MTIPRHYRVFVWFAILLVLAEVATRFAIERPDHQDSSPPVRNETPWRNWPEHVRSGGNNADLLVYIGNSQAVGPEFPDAKKIYPATLQQIVNKHSPSVRFENWSVIGLRTGQLELLTVQALDRGARHLVIALSLNNFERRNILNAAADPSDIRLLSGRLPLWSNHFATLTGNVLPLDTRLENVLQYHSALLRSRIEALDQAAMVLPRFWQRNVIGHQRSTAYLRDLRQKSPETRQRSRRQLQNPVPLAVARAQMRDQRLPVFRAFYDHFAPIFKETDTRVLWLWIPMAILPDTQGMMQAASELQDELCRDIRDDGWPCHNLSRTLPADHFIPSMLSSHLNESGHQAMARLLTPLVRDALH